MNWRLGQGGQRAGLTLLAGVALLGVVYFWGCNWGRPRAPALADGPVYQNSQEGFRFLVPDGWTQYASALAPPGKAEDERMLVEYQLISTAQPASLKVTRIDLPAEANLPEYVQSHTPAPDYWRLNGPAQPLNISGAEATRISLIGSVQKRADSVREVTAFRRGERVYLFVANFSPTDTKAQQEIRRAVDTVIWKN